MQGQTTAVLRSARMMLDIITMDRSRNHALWYVELAHDEISEIPYVTFNWMI